MLMNRLLSGRTASQLWTMATKARSVGGLSSTRSFSVLNRYRALRKDLWPLRGSVMARSVSTKSAHLPTAQELKTRTRMGYWLVGTSGLVFGIVILGGLTRLTESGLSITEWKPVTGTLPPMSQQQWDEEFAKYRESPEFKLLNSHIDLDEFKFIYFMEWIHRLWGRAIGGVFILPCFYFAMSRASSPHINRRLFGLSGLLALQGFLGWWMVKSGLDQEQLDARKSKPTVSQYRLTTHLSAAFILYMGMLWTGWEILREVKWAKNPEYASKIIQQLQSSKLNPMRRISLGLVALTFLTAMSGGMVAGLDAGLIYNTFPRMGDNWFPSKRELLDENFARKDNKSDLWWRNMLENPTTVQLNHRILAMTTFCAVFAAHMYQARIKKHLPRTANMSMRAMMGVVTAQLALGILTLWYVVPISLASMHQAGALALLTSTLLFASQVRKPRMATRNMISLLNANKSASHQQSIIVTEAFKPKSV